jgi:ABC-type glycerol-3-phosphate transport system permease component
MQGSDDMKKKLNVSNIMIFSILAMTALIFLVPFIWTFVTSIKDNKEIYSPFIILIPSNATFEHYHKVLTQMSDFILYFRNTIVVTFWSVIGTVILSAMTGYAFAKTKFAGKNIYLAFILLILTLPYAIYLIPIYIMEDKVNLINTYTGLILPYIAINLPLSIFIMRGQFNSIPDGLMEAATIDGCNFFQVWYKIMLPIAKPGVAIIIIFTFINVWGEFLFARTLTATADAQTLAVGITFLRDEAASWQYGTLSATIILSLIPLMAIFLSMQKYFIRGIMEGALKG